MATQTTEEQEENTTDFCQFPYCRGVQSTIIWLGMGLCDKHWNEIAEMDSKEARKKLKIK